MPKIAIVHDYFIQQGGAERVAVELQRLFPGAPMYTTVDAGNQGWKGKRLKELGESGEVDE